jgi:hypothetical protein
MKDFGVPLEIISIERYILVGATAPTLSMTFSSEFGQSIAKHTKRRSVSGYERGRSRSYSSCPAVSHRASSTALPVGLCVVCVI